MGKRPNPGGRYAGPLEDGPEGARSGPRPHAESHDPRPRRRPRRERREGAGADAGAGAAARRHGADGGEETADGRQAAAEAPAETPAEGGRKRRLELNLPQVAGSAVAAVLAAKFASNLGVYGTILGAGVVSAVATCSGSVFQHFFRRTGEQLREVTVQRRPRVRQTPALVTSGGQRVPETFRPMRPVADGESSGSWAGRSAAWGVPTTTWGVGQPARDPDVAARTAGETATRPLHTGRAVPGARRAEDTSTRLLRRYQAGRHETQVLHRDEHAAARHLANDTDVRDDTDVRQGHDADATRLLARNEHAGHALAGLDTATRLLHRARPVPGDPRDPAHTAVLRRPDDRDGLAGSGVPGVPDDPAGSGTVVSGDGPPPEAFTEGTVHRARARRLKRPLVAAGVVFAVAMGGITTYELASGHSLNGDRMRTTIGDVLSGGGSESGHHPTTPAVTPSGQPSQGSDGTDRHTPGGGDPQVSQTPEQSSPTPTPSGSQGSGTAPDPSTGADSGGGQGAGSDGGSGGRRQSSTPTPTPTGTQSDGSDGGAGTATGGSATRQPGSWSGG